MKKFYTTALFAIVFSVVAFAQNAPKVSALDPTVKRLPASKVDASKMMTRGSKEAFHFRAVKNSVWGAKKAEAEQTSWVWDFEDEAQIEGWTFIDNDGDGHNWTYFNNTGLETGRMTAHEGEGLISSASYDNDTGTPLTPDNWMISPKMTLGGALKFWAAGQDASYSAEVFAVYVCVGDPAGVESFTKISDDITATAEYVEYGFDLSAYEGQEGCFAIRHYNVTDMFWLNIDDITLDIEETYVAPPMTPENVTADPTATTADIAWEQPDNAANWNLRYRPYTLISHIMDMRIRLPISVFTMPMVTATTGASTILTTLRQIFALVQKVGILLQVLLPLTTGSSHLYLSLVDQYRSGHGQHQPTIQKTLAYS